MANATIALRNSTVYQTVTTNSDGFYTIPTALNGNYVMEVNLYPQYKPLLVYNLPIRGQRIQRNYSIEKYKSGIIVGQVLKTSSSPGTEPAVPDANLILEEADVDGQLLVGKTNGRTISSVNGRFVFTDIRQGLYKLYCQAPGYSAFYKYVRVESGISTTINFDVSTIEYEVTGFVFNSSIDVTDIENRGLLGVSVTVDEIVGFEAVVSDSFGKYKLLLKTGSYTLRYFMPGRQEKTQVVTVDSNTVAPDISLNESMASVNVALQTAAGASVSNYSVLVTPGNFRFQSAGSTLQFTLPGNSDYSMTFFLPDNQNSNYGVSPIDFHLTSNESKALNVTVAEYTNITGTVIDENNVPVRNVRIGFAATGNFAYSNAQGVFSFRVPLVNAPGASFVFTAAHEAYLQRPNTDGTVTPLTSNFAGLQTVSIRLVSKKNYYSELAKNKFLKEIENAKKVLDAFNTSIPQRYIATLQGIGASESAELENNVGYFLSDLTSINTDLTSYKEIPASDFSQYFKEILKYLSRGTTVSTNLGTNLSDLLSSLGTGSETLLSAIKSKLVGVWDIHQSSKENLSDRIDDNYDLTRADRQIVLNALADVTSRLSTAKSGIQTGYTDAVSKLVPNAYTELEKNVLVAVNDYNTLRDYFNGRMQSDLSPKDYKSYQLAKKAEKYYLDLYHTVYGLNGDLLKVLTPYERAKARLNILQDGYSSYLQVVEDIRVKTVGCISLIRTIRETWANIAGDTDLTNGLQSVIDTKNQPLFNIDANNGTLVFNESLKVALNANSIAAMNKFDLDFKTSEFLLQYITASAGQNQNQSVKKLADLLGKNPTWEAFWTSVSSPGFSDGLTAIENLLEVIPTEFQAFADIGSLNWLDTVIDTLPAINSSVTNNNWWIKYIINARKISKENTPLLSYELNVDQLLADFGSLGTDVTSEKLFISYIYNSSKTKASDYLINALGVEQSELIDTIYSFRAIEKPATVDLISYLATKNSIYNSFRVTSATLESNDATTLAIFTSLRTYLQSPAVKNVKFALIPTSLSVINEYSDNPSENFPLIATSFKKSLVDLLKAKTPNLQEDATVLTTVNSYYPEKVSMDRVSNAEIYCSEILANVCSSINTLSQISPEDIKSMFSTNILKTLFPIYLVVPSTPKEYSKSYADIDISYLKINYKESKTPEERYYLDFSLKYVTKAAVANLGFSGFTTSPLVIKNSGLLATSVAITPQLPGSCSQKPNPNKAGKTDYTLSDGTLLTVTGSGYSSRTSVYTEDQAQQLFMANCSTKILGYQYVLKEGVSPLFNIEGKHIIFEGKIILANKGADVKKDLSGGPLSGTSLQATVPSDAVQSAVKFVNIDRGAIDIANQRIVALNLSLSQEIVLNESIAKGGKEKVAFYLDKVAFTGSGKLEFTGYAQPTFTKATIWFTNAKKIKLTKLYLDTQGAGSTIPAPIGLPSTGGQGIRDLSVSYAVIDAEEQEALGFGVTLKVNDIIYRKVDEDTAELTFGEISAKIPILLPIGFQIKRIRMQVGANAKPRLLIDAPETPWNFDLLDIAGVIMIIPKKIGFFLDEEHDSWSFSISLGVSFRNAEKMLNIKDIHLICSNELDMYCFVDKLKAELEFGLVRGEFTFGLLGPPKKGSTITGGLGAGSIILSLGQDMGGAGTEKQKGIEMFVWVDKTDFGFYISALFDIEMKVAVWKQVGGGLFRSGDYWLAMLTGTMFFKFAPCTDLIGTFKIAGRPAEGTESGPHVELQVELAITYTMSPEKVASKLSGGLAGKLRGLRKQMEDRSKIGTVASKLLAPFNSTGTTYNENPLGALLKQAINSKLYLNDSSSTLDISTSPGNSHNASTYLEEAKAMADGVTFYIGEGKGFIELSSHPEAHIFGKYGLKFFGVKYFEGQGEFVYEEHGRLDKPTIGLYLMISRGADLFKGMLGSVKGDVQLTIALGTNYMAPWEYRGLSVKVPLFSSDELGLLVALSINGNISLAVFALDIGADIFMAAGGPLNEKSKSSPAFTGGIYAGFNLSVGPMLVTAFADIGGTTANGKYAKSTEEGLTINEQEAGFRGIAVFKACLIAGLVCDQTRKVHFAYGTKTGWDATEIPDPSLTTAQRIGIQNFKNVTSLDLTLHRELGVNDERDNTTTGTSNLSNSSLIDGHAVKKPLTTDDVSGPLKFTGRALTDEQAADLSTLGEPIGVAHAPAGATAYAPGSAAAAGLNPNYISPPIPGSGVTFTGYQVPAGGQVPTPPPLPPITGPGANIVDGDTTPGLVASRTAQFESANRVNAAGITPGLVSSRVMQIEAANNSVDPDDDPADGVGRLFNPAPRPPVRTSSLPGNGANADSVDPDDDPVDGVARLFNPAPRPPVRTSSLPGNGANADSVDPDDDPVDGVARLFNPAPRPPVRTSSLPGNGANADSVDPDDDPADGVARLFNPTRPTRPAPAPPEDGPEYGPENETDDQRTRRILSSRGDVNSLPDQAVKPAPFKATDKSMMNLRRHVKQKRPVRPVKQFNGAIAGRTDYDMLLGCDVFLVPTWNDTNDLKPLVLPPKPAGPSLQSVKAYENALDDYLDALDLYMAEFNYRRLNAVQYQEELKIYAAAKEKEAARLRALGKTEDEVTQLVTSGVELRYQTNSTGKTETVIVTRDNNGNEIITSAKTVALSTDASATAGVEVQDYSYKYRRDGIGNVYFSQLPSPTTKIGYRLIIMRKPDNGVWIPYDEPIDLKEPKYKYGVKLVKAETQQEKVFVVLTDGGQPTNRPHQIELYKDLGLKKDYIGSLLLDENTGETDLFNQEFDKNIYPGDRLLVDVYAPIDENKKVDAENRYFIQQERFVVSKSTNSQQAIEIPLLSSTVTRQGEIHQQDALVKFDVKFYKRRSGQDTIIAPLEYTKGQDDRPTYNICFKTEKSFEGKNITDAIATATQPICGKNANDLVLKKAGLIHGGNANIIRTNGSSSSNFVGAILPYLTEYYVSQNAKTETLELSPAEKKLKLDRDLELRKLFNGGSGILGSLVQGLTGTSTTSGDRFRAVGTLAEVQDQNAINQGGVATTKTPIDLDFVNGLTKIYLVIEAVVQDPDNDKLYKLTANYAEYTKGVSGGWTFSKGGTPVKSVANMVPKVVLKHTPRARQRDDLEDEDNNIGDISDLSIYYDPNSRGFYINTIPTATPSVSYLDTNSTDSIVEEYKSIVDKYKSGIPNAKRIAIQEELKNSMANSIGLLSINRVPLLSTEVNFRRYNTNKKSTIL